MADRIYRTQGGASGDVSMDPRDVRNVGLAGEDGSKGSGGLGVGGKGWAGPGRQWREQMFRGRVDTW